MSIRWSLRRPPVAVLVALLLALIALPASCDEPAPLAGHWEGAIEIPGLPLKVLLDFAAGEDGAMKGTISIPAQNARDLPLEMGAVPAPGASFTIAGIPGAPTFEGIFNEDGTTLTGTFTQGGQSFPFTLAKRIPGQDAKAALEGLDEVLASALATFDVPGLAVAVVKDKEVVYQKGFGFRDRERKLPATPNTLFAIGSSTKAFTTFVLGTLVDEGKLDWDEPVRTYIPWFRLQDASASERITPRDLVTHRSGLPRHDLLWYNNTEGTRKFFVERLAYLEPSADLRERFQYNNAMYLTAGYLAEAVSGQVWEDLVRARILDPLAMVRTNFSVEKMASDQDAALGYEKKEGEVAKVPYRPITNMGPAGSINSSASEMARWLTVQVNDGLYGANRLAEAATVREMHLAQMTTGATVDLPEITPADYALGWMVDTYRGHRRLHHGGNIDGFTAQVAFMPQEGLGVVALANLGGTPLPELVARTVFDRVLGLEPKDWMAEAAGKRAVAEGLQKEARAKRSTVRKPGTKPAHALPEYAGSYAHPGYGTVTFALEAGKLSARYNGILTPLEHWHYETFSGLKGEDDTYEDMKYTFRTDAKGNVAAVEVPMEPAVKDIVFERQPDARLSDPSYLGRLVGTYELGPQVVTVGLRGSTLTVLVPGQPLYDLVPGLGGEFLLKRYQVVSLKFLEDEKGAVTGVEFRQPDGVYTAKRSN